MQVPMINRNTKISKNSVFDKKKTKFVWKLQQSRNSFTTHTLKVHFLSYRWRYSVMVQKISCNKMNSKTRIEYFLQRKEKTHALLNNYAPSEIEEEKLKTRHFYKLLFRFGIFRYHGIIIMHVGFRGVWAATWSFARIISWPVVLLWTNRASVRLRQFL